jgi:hypothetical protein
MLLLWWPISATRSAMVCPWGVAESSITSALHICTREMFYFGMLTLADHFILQTVLR